MYEFVRSQLEVCDVKKRLLDLGRTAISFAEQFGATQAEVYLESNRSIEVTMEKGAVRLASNKLDTGCGFRVAVGNQIGVSYVTSLLEADLKQAASNAIKAAKSSLADSDFVSFLNDSATYPSVRKTYDGSIDEMTAEVAVDLLRRCVASSQEVSGKERNMIEGLLRTSTLVRSVVNSLGIEAASIDSKIDLQAYSTIGSGDNQSSSGEDQCSCNLSEIDPEFVGSESAKNALSLRGAKTIAGGKMPLILAPKALMAVLGSGFFVALDAKRIQDGKSYLQDALGTELSSSNLKIEDNGVLEGGIGSRLFDSEGNASRRTAILDSGILKSYLYDFYTAKKDDVEPTSNAYRSSYRVTPGINTSNLVVSPGSGDIEDLMSEAGTGVLCAFTFDRPNYVTGELSAMIMEGFYFERGEIKYALKNSLFGITMQDLLKNVIRVGADVRMQSIDLRVGLVAPSILIDSVTITSG